MKSFSVFDQKTGQCLRAGSCADGDVSLQAQQGETVLQTVAVPGLDYLSGDGVARRPDAPGPHHIFDWDAKVWCLCVDRAWSAVREARNARLKETDYLMLEDAVVSNRDAWVGYRQALRDVTQQPDPLRIVWPERPA